VNCCIPEELTGVSAKAEEGLSADRFIGSNKEDLVSEDGHGAVTTARDWGFPADVLIDAPLSWWGLG
jgi:hypothetical protein